MREHDPRKQIFPLVAGNVLAVVVIVDHAVGSTVADASYS
jgi:hypothetical protein